VQPVNYDERLFHVYDRGRAITPDVGRLWMNAIRRHLSPRPVQRILDLGSGTGRFSTLLAESFQATVLAVEPSGQMRTEAAKRGLSSDIRSVNGAAENIPANDEEFDLAWLSMMIHHVQDRTRCAKEVRRVMRPGGLIFIRNSFSQRLQSVRYFEFFPEARALDESRLPTLATVRSDMTSCGLEFVAHEAVLQQIDVSLKAHCDRIALRAISTLELISDSAFAAGVERMRAAAQMESIPNSVMEEIDLLVFQRP
jgi:ubiquinone/menaquinone biosynthesis C-methylase UbiE